ncbi:MAG: hypothetical protein JKY34_09345, partial [Kordiimonadaceae bacterium]|nr:hypothetical protein [Kordiimonadaceae bacterium]
MKKILLICAVTITGIDLPVVAAMNDTTTKEIKADKKAKHSHRHGGGGHSKKAFMTTYDLNDDGHVDLAEFYVRRDKGYDIRDADSNNSVGADEYVAEYEVRLDKQLAERRDRQLKQAYVRFDVLDKDKDGVMTRDEFKISG